MKTVYWSGIIAGVLITLGLQLMFLFLGNSMGIVPYDQDVNLLDQKTYVFTFVAMLFANFIGGFSSVSFSPAVRMIPAGLIALTAWALNSLIGLVLSNTVSPATQILSGISWFAFFISWWTFFISFFGAIAALAGGLLALFYKEKKAVRMTLFEKSDSNRTSSQKKENDKLSA